MWGLEIVILLAAVGCLFYKWSVKGFDTFHERGIPYEKPLPLIGNSFAFVKNTKSLHKIMIELYRKTKEHKIYGFLNFRVPFFIINNPELIRQLGIKDFDSFVNHQRFFNIEADPVLGHLITVMRDHRWRHMRNDLTPLFTGAKMRSMFTLMMDCFAEAIQYLQRHLKDGSDSFDMEMKECFSRLSNDIIATTAFGVNVNSFKDKNNEFFTIGRVLTKGQWKRALKFMIYSLAPKIHELLKLKMIEEENVDYFTRFVVDAMKLRQEQNIVRPDMIQLLIETTQESKNQWSQNEVVAQCLIFFFAAFENNANLLCTTCHELMENPGVQDNLLEEILETKNELDGKTLDYDTLKKMKYMDMVLSEALRKWSLAAMLDRECGKDYTLKDEDGNFICELKKGDRIWFQLIGLQWSDEYFEHPEIFEPERFSEENKNKIKPFTYMPFGIGPRACIGNRYALMQAKAMLYYLLQEFKLERAEKSSKNLLDDGRGFELAPKKGFWLKLRKRNGS